jgi:tyrosyl-tRNA synthetase
MFGKVMSISDTLMLRYYELLTSDDLGAVKRRHPMDAKRSLAEQIVSRYHDAEAARHAKEEFQQRFQEREFPSQPDARVVLKQADVTDPQHPAISVLDLITKTKLVPSKSEARRLIIQGGVEIEEQKRTDPNESLLLKPGQQYRIRVGRRKTAIVEFHRE